MTNYQESLQAERLNLAKTLAVLQQELERDSELSAERRHQLISDRRAMWEDTAHYSYDFARVTEISQYLAQLNSQTASYGSVKERIRRYARLLDSPYFGRFDFEEEGLNLIEPIYLGLHTITNSQTHEILVYDWRAPISSIFYRCELGRADYPSPMGVIKGNVSLKRQYKITNSELKYFFDCSLVINDEILQEVLSANASPKMKTIVETIQKEQDQIIRDQENELILVQGSAGSGKTSIALHRIAFQLYNGMKGNLQSENFLIISPNDIFSSYISNVLPSLGEENVTQTTFDELTRLLIGNFLHSETRAQYQEYLITAENPDEAEQRRENCTFKGSAAFAKILDRFIQLYERRLIPIEDVYFHGQIVENKQQLKMQLLNNKIGMPLAKRLSRIEQRLFEKLHPLQKLRLKKITPIVQKSEGRALEIKSYSRLLAIKESQALAKRIRKFTRVNFLALYQLLFEQPQLLSRLARGLELPANIDNIIFQTKRGLESGLVDYEDCAPLLYLKLKLEGNSLFPKIKQVVIDEAQDYSPMQYKVFQLLLPEAGYTVLGDINQSLDLGRDLSYYDRMAEILNKTKAVKLILNKTYRSSFEINTFAHRLLPQNQDIIPFSRHETEPVVVKRDSPEALHEALLADVASYMEQGYSSIGIICKSEKVADQLAMKLKEKTTARVISAYLAKGLEFDVVLVYDVSRNNYSTIHEQRLLYIACTRALHRLALYYTGEKSIFI